MSSPTAGNFDAARLQEIKVRMDALINPNEVKAAEYIPDIAALKMVQAIQTIQIPGLDDPLKDNTFKAIWPDNCDDEQPEDDPDNSCSIEGAQIGLVSKDFSLNESFYKTFSVSERKYRSLGSTISFDEEIAINQLKTMKLMDEGWSRRTIAGLDSMVGVNKNGSPYNVTNPHTEVPAAAWNEDLFTYLAVTKDQNKMPGMQLFLGGLMQTALRKIALETSNPTGASAARKVAQLGNVYSDNFLTETVLGHKAAYLVSPSALGIVTKAYNIPYGAGREEVAQGNKQIHYTITSPNSGITYDVTYQIECVTTSGVKDWLHTWKFSTKGEVVTNAVFCDTDRTGVLKFRCV